MGEMVDITGSASKAGGGGYAIERRDQTSLHLDVHAFLCPDAPRFGAGRLARRLFGGWPSTHSDSGPTDSHAGVAPADRAARNTSADPHQHRPVSGRSLSARPAGRRLVLPGERCGAAARRLSQHGFVHVDRARPVRGGPRDPLVLHRSSRRRRRLSQPVRFEFPSRNTVREIASAPDPS